MLFTLPRAPHLPPFWDYQSPDRHISLPTLCSESVLTHSFFWSAGHSSCSQEPKCGLAGRYRHPPRGVCFAQGILPCSVTPVAWGLPEPQQPLGVCSLNPDSPAHHQPSCRPSASMVHLGPSSCSAQLGNRDVLGCLPSLGSRCWQHPGFEHCGDMETAQTGSPRGPVALLWATTALLCHPRKVNRDRSPWWRQGLFVERCAVSVAWGKGMQCDITDKPWHVTAYNT